jgi:hypothetical protein
MSATKVVALNNSAVTSLLSGRPKRALALLSRATALLKDNNVADANAPCCSPPSSPNETPLSHRRYEIPRFVSESSPHQYQSNLSSSTPSRTRNGEGNGNYSTAMEMYLELPRQSVFSFQVWTSSLSHQDVPLILNYSCALAVFDYVQDKDLLTGVVLYNMALVNHCRAIELGISSLLSIALNLYKMAASILEISSDVDASNQLVLLALYNNMAQIHAYQWSSKEVRVCIDKIRMLLSTVSLEIFIDQQELEFFFLHTILHVEDQMNLAPAA